MRIFFPQPTQGRSQKGVEGSQILIRFGHMFDGLGKVRGGQETRIRLAKPCVGLFHPGFSKMMQGGATGHVPGNFALMEEIQMPLEWTARLGGPASMGTDDSVAACQPDGEQARLPLTAEMKQNSFILKR